MCEERDNLWKQYDMVLKKYIASVESIISTPGIDHAFVEPPSGQRAGPPIKLA
jgi:hypothetical protein